MSSSVVVIYDNSSERTLLSGLAESLKEALQGSTDNLIPLRICTGYFHLYAWGALRERLATTSAPLSCHLLVGMHRQPEYEQQASQLSLFSDGQALKDAILKSLLAQVNQGIPTAEKERRLRLLIEDLDKKRLTIKAYLCDEPLHGKLYLIEKPSGDFRWLAYVGSSNFTLAGLERQGELNVKITDQTHAGRLSEWFEGYWGKPCSEDISQALLDGLRQHTWVGYLEAANWTPAKPYLVYLRMAYLLAEKLIQASEVELSEQLMQGDFRLLEFQKLAVSQLIFLLEKRGGALLGDVVGLGKTFTASAVARTLFEQHGYATLVICPPALIPMWESYLHRFLIPGKVLSMGAVQDELSRLSDRQYGLVIIDESHNLRNPESKRYKAIQAFIQQRSPKPKVLLLSATPYSKAFSDLGAQLQLFLQTHQPLGIRPLYLIKDLRIRTLGEFKRKYGFAWDTLAAFMKSLHKRDWQELMQLFLVRRTRSYIKKNFAQRDKDGRHFILQGKERLYFPERVIKTIQYHLRPKSRYEALLSDKVIDMIDECTLPRYGLAEYIRKDAKPEDKDKELLEGLTRAGTQLRGFLKAALFKRLESSGYSFLLSLYRLILRNEVFLYAIRSGKPLPIGTIQVEENVPPSLMLNEDIRESDDWDGSLSILDKICALSENEQRTEAEKIYGNLGDPKQIKYIDLNYFDTARLQKDLESDNKTFRKILKMGCPWKPEEDEKLMELIKFIEREGSREKLIIFTQFADTAYYIGEALKLQLGKKEGKDFAVITSKEKDILTVVRRFSPRSNGGLPEGLSELPLLISTDVLSEGQNLQDARHLINYDLPWTVIELVQRAGRIDRLGQQAEKVFIYSFLPAKKLDELLRLTERLIKRLEESGAVLGSDEKFFQEEQVKRYIEDLYVGSEEVQKLMEEAEDAQSEENDLIAQAWAVWQQAEEKDRQQALALPPQIWCEVPIIARKKEQRASLVALFRLAEGFNALMEVDEEGNLLPLSPLQIFQQAQCPPETSALPFSEEEKTRTYKLIEACWKTFQEDPTRHAAGKSGSPARRLREIINSYMRTGVSLPGITDEKQAVLQKILRLLDQGKPLADHAIKALSGREQGTLILEAIELFNEGQLFLEKEGEAILSEPQFLCAIRFRQP